MSVEQKILFLAEAPGCYQSRELCAIAFEVRKLEDRIKQLEAKVDELHDLEKWLEGR